MGEAILTRGCYGGGDNGSNDVINVTPTEGTYTINGHYICTRDGNYLVQCLGGGGGGGSFYIYNGGSSTGYQGMWAGSGGSLSNLNIYMNRGDAIPITIGYGGLAGNGTTTWGSANFAGNTGGTTSFGTYLSATGGSGANSVGNWPYNTSTNTSTQPRNNTYIDSSGLLYSTNANGTNVTTYGQGGKGGYGWIGTSGLHSGGNGKDGVIVIRYLDW